MWKKKSQQQLEAFFFKRNLLLFSSYYKNVASIEKREIHAWYNVDNERTFITLFLSILDIIILDFIKEFKNWYINLIIKSHSMAQVNWQKFLASYFCM